MKISTVLFCIAILVIITDVNGQIIATYDAGIAGSGDAPSPTTQGWIYETTGQAGLTQSGVSPDEDYGLNAWNISDTEQFTYNYHTYHTPMTEQQHADAWSHGWRLTVISRMVDDFGSSGFAAEMLYGDGEKQIAVMFGLTEDGNLKVLTVSEDPVTHSEYIVTNNGIGNSYNTHDLIFYPNIGDSGEASYFFNGTLIASGLTAMSHFSYIGPEWGMRNSPGIASMNFNFVQFEILPEPSSLILLGIGGLLLKRKK